MARFASFTDCDINNLIINKDSQNMKKQNSEIDTSDIKLILLISSVMVPDKTIICK